MAIPQLYWMLECTGCATRFVVHDSYLRWVGTSNPNAPEGAGYEGPPLPERHRCPKYCATPLKAIASLSSPYEPTMWLFQPHIPIEMTEDQSEEWRRLIRDAGLAESRDHIATSKPWWRIW
jgi:hypothetical protein